MRITAPAIAAIALIGAASVPALALQDGAPQVPGAVDVERVSGGTYVVDPAHTLVGWSVSHFGFNPYFGTFGKVEGTLTIDPANPSAAKVDVTIPITSVAVVSEGLRDHLLRPGSDGGEPDFFGSDPAPARFVSEAVTLYGDGTKALIVGRLAMNGQVAPVTIEAKFTGAGANPRSGVETIGFVGETEIDRSHFGIDYGIPMVGDKVKLLISAAFEKQ